MYLNLKTYCLGFWVKRSKVKVTAGGDITVDDKRWRSI